MFGWGGDGSRSLEQENQELKAQIKELESGLDHKHFVCVDSAPCIVFGVGPGLIVRIWNQEAARVLGLSKTEAEGQDLDSVLSENADMFKTVIESSVANDTDSSAPINMEVSLPGKDSKRILLLNCRTRRDSSGRVIDTIFLGQDITERFPGP